MRPEATLQERLQQRHSRQWMQQVAVVVGIDCGEVLSFFLKELLLLVDVVGEAVGAAEALTGIAVVAAVAV